MSFTIVKFFLPRLKPFTNVSPKCDHSQWLLGPCTLRPIYFFIFPTKTEKGHITYPYHVCIFQSTEKKGKKEKGQENRSFFHFSNFEVKFKNTKNTVNGQKRYFSIFIFLILLEK